MPMSGGYNNAVCKTFVFLIIRFLTGYKYSAKIRSKAYREGIKFSLNSHSSCQIFLPHFFVT